MARFLVDAQLPPAAAHLLVGRGHGAEDVFDIGLGLPPDRRNWDYAPKNEAILITKDEDFPDLVSLGVRSPTIGWGRIGSTRNRPLREWLEPFVGYVVDLAYGGEKLIEHR